MKSQIRVSDFDVTETYLIEGPSGSGKSSVLAQVVGLSLPMLVLDSDWCIPYPVWPVYHTITGMGGEWSERWRRAVITHVEPMIAVASTLHVGLVIAGYHAWEFGGIKLLPAAGMRPDHFRQVHAARSQRESWKALAKKEAKSYPSQQEFNEFLTRADQLVITQHFPNADKQGRAPVDATTAKEHNEAVLFEATKGFQSTSV